MRRDTIRPNYDYSKLRGRIIEKFGTIGKFCKAIEKSNSHVSMVLNGSRYWSYNEVFLICKALDIPLSEVGVYFFTQKVHKIETF